MKDELNEILFREKLSKRELADELLMSHGYVRKTLMESAEGYPHWVRAFVTAYKLGKLTGRMEAEKEQQKSANDPKSRIVTDLRTAVEKREDERTGGWRERFKKLKEESEKNKTKNE